MRYRKFGTSELQVSEVGFGTWTLASDWWGVVEDKRGMLDAALNAGITFFDTSPVYGDDGLGESLMADFLSKHRDEIVLTTKCGYDISANRKTKGQSERPHDWRPESIREQCESSLKRLGIEYIDLYQLHNARIEPILDDDLWAALEDLRTDGKIGEIGVALGPAIGWVEEGLEAIRRRPICSLQTVYNVIEQEPGRTFVEESIAHGSKAGMISRVPHASDALSGRVTRETVFPPSDHRSHRNRDNMLDNFDKADTLAFLWEGTGRTRGQAAIAAILSNPNFTNVLPTCVTVEEIDEYAAATEFPLTPDEIDAVEALWSTNFGVTNRYQMKLKASR